MKTKNFSALDLFLKEEDKLAQTQLSSAEYTCWNDTLIEKYKDVIDWDLLSGNAGVRWSKELIMRYEDRWEWRALSYIIANVLDEMDFRHTLFIFKSSISWSIICQGININPLIVEDYPEYIHWQSLSANTLFNWSEDFVEKHKDKIDWDDFSAAFHSDIFRKYTRDSMPEEERESFNSFINDFISRYMDRWNWDHLSGNTRLIFQKDFLQAFRSKWNWNLLVNNKAVVWSYDLLEEFNSELSKLSGKELKESFLWECMQKEAGDRFRNKDVEFMLVLF